MQRMRCAAPARPPEDLVRRFLDAGVRARLSFTSILVVYVTLMVMVPVVGIFLSNNDFLRYLPHLLLGFAAAVVLALSQVVGAADREGIRPHIGRTKRWADFVSQSSRSTTRHYRNKMTRQRGTDTTYFTILDFTTGRLELTALYTRNTAELKTFAEIAVAHALPARFGHLLETQDAYRALSAFEARPAHQQVAYRPILAGPLPWVLAVIPLGVAVLFGHMTLQHLDAAENARSRASWDPDWYARLYTAKAKRKGLVAGVAALVALSAAGAGAMARSAHQRRIRALRESDGPSPR